MFVNETSDDRNHSEYKFIWGRPKVLILQQRCLINDTRWTNFTYGVQI